MTEEADSVDQTGDETEDDSVGPIVDLSPAN